MRGAGAAADEGRRDCHRGVRGGGVLLRVDRGGGEVKPIRPKMPKTFCSFCEQHVPSDSIHSCYDAKELRRMLEEEKKQEKKEGIQFHLQQQEDDFYGK